MTSNIFEISLNITWYQYIHFLIVYFIPTLDDLVILDTSLKSSQLSSSITTLKNFFDELWSLAQIFVLQALQKIVVSPTLAPVSYKYETSLLSQCCCWSERVFFSSFKRILERLSALELPTTPTPALASPTGEIAWKSSPLEPTSPPPGTPATPPPGPSAEPPWPAHTLLVIWRKKQNKRNEVCTHYYNETKTTRWIPDKSHNDLPFNNYFRSDFFFEWHFFILDHWGRGHCRNILPIWRNKRNR